jgi:ribosomal protein L40E
MTSSAILTERAPRRRRIPLLVFGAAGALLAGAFAVGVERLRIGPPLVMIALGGMTLGLTAAALRRVIDPLTRGETGGAGSTVAPARARELDREKQLVLKAIKEIELDYQMRKIAERDYREMIERYRARALRLMSEIEAGDDFTALIEKELQIRLAAAAAAPPPQPQPVAEPAADGRRACAQCATANDPDAEFCKKCGQKLSS